MSRRLTILAWMWVRKLWRTRGSIPIAEWHINMPIMDAIRAGYTRTRRSSRSRRRALCILHIGRYLQLGANAYITKPIEAPQVIAKVKELLNVTHAPFRMHRIRRGQARRFRCRAGVPGHSRSFRPLVPSAVWHARAILPAHVPFRRARRASSTSAIILTSTMNRSRGSSSLSVLQAVLDAVLRLALATVSSRLGVSDSSVSSIATDPSSKTFASREDRRAFEAVGQADDLLFGLSDVLRQHVPQPLRCPRRGLRYGCAPRRKRKKSSTRRGPGPTWHHVEERITVVEHVRPDPVGGVGYGRASPAPGRTC